VTIHGSSVAFLHGDLTHLADDQPTRARLRGRRARRAERRGGRGERAVVGMAAHGGARLPDDERRDETEDHHAETGLRKPCERAAQDQRERDDAEADEAAADRAVRQVEVLGNEVVAEDAPEDEQRDRGEEEDRRAVGAVTRARSSRGTQGRRGSRAAWRPAPGR